MQQPFNNLHKQRTGLTRLTYALLHSIAGLKAAWTEKAFRSEACLAVVLVPAAFWLGQNWVEVSVLTASVILVLVVELLNTAVESSIDRIGAEWHELSKKAKDLGSAAVLLTLLLWTGIWGAAIWQRFMHS